MAHLTKTFQGNLKPSLKVKKQLQFISKGCNEVYNYFLRKRKKEIIAEYQQAAEDKELVPQLKKWDILGLNDKKHGKEK